MPQKKTTLKEAMHFARENGYLFATYKYKKQDDNYVLIDEADTAMELAEEYIDIMVETSGQGIGLQTDFNEFTSVDKQYCFRLHNNFNVPNIIPIIRRD
jgi:hypothetical protein